MAAVFRAIFGYCLLILVVRIAGRRPGKQLTPFEYVLIFFIGGLTLTGMVNDDRSLTNALAQIIAVAGTHCLITWLRLRWKAFGKLVDGTPLVLLSKERWHLETMQNMHLSDDDVMAAAREKGLTGLDQISYAVFERSGAISVIPKSE
jgi:uncharacterized membrane protein YcaP (DUF421 family)